MSRHSLCSVRFGAGVRFPSFPKKQTDPRTRYHLTTEMEKQWAGHDALNIVVEVEIHHQKISILSRA